LSTEKTYFPAGWKLWYTGVEVVQLTLQLMKQHHVECHSEWSVSLIQHYHTYCKQVSSNIQVGKVYLPCLLSDNPSL